MYMSVYIVLVYIFLVVTSSLNCVVFVFDPMLCLYCGGIGGDESRNVMEVSPLWNS